MCAWLIDWLLQTFHILFSAMVHGLVFRLFITVLSKTIKTLLVLFRISMNILHNIMLALDVQILFSSCNQGGPLWPPCTWLTKLFIYGTVTKACMLVHCNIYTMKITWKCFLYYWHYFIKLPWQRTSNLCSFHIHLKSFNLFFSLYKTQFCHLKDIG